MLESPDSASDVKESFMNSDVRDSFEGGDVCRVCRCPAELPERPLCRPCVCSGSIGFVHSDCLQAWLKISKKDTCSLCNHKFKLTPLYPPGTPYILGPFELGVIMNQRLLKLLPFVCRVILVLVCWIGVVPLGTCWVYRLWLWRTSYLPVSGAASVNFAGDWAQGLFLCVSIVTSFLAIASFVDFVVSHRLYVGNALSEYLEAKNIPTEDPTNNNAEEVVPAVNNVDEVVPAVNNVEEVVPTVEAKVPEIDENVADEPLIVHERNIEHAEYFIFDGNEYIRRGPGREHENMNQMDNFEFSSDSDDDMDLPELINPLVNNVNNDERIDANIGAINWHDDDIDDENFADIFDAVDADDNPNVDNPNFDNPNDADGVNFPEDGEDEQVLLDVNLALDELLGLRALQISDKIMEKACAIPINSMLPSALSSQHAAIFKNPCEAYVNRTSAEYRSPFETVMFGSSRWSYENFSGQSEENNIQKPLDISSHDTTIQNEKGMLHFFDILHNVIVYIFKVYSNMKPGDLSTYILDIQTNLVTKISNTYSAIFSSFSSFYFVSDETKEDLPNIVTNASLCLNVQSINSNHLSSAINTCALLDDFWILAIGWLLFGLFIVFSKMIGKKIHGYVPSSPIVLRIMWFVFFTSCVYKMALFLSIKIVILPIFFGAVLEYACLPLITREVIDMKHFFLVHPGCSLSMHWVLGVCYMLFITLFLLELRSQLHPDVLTKFIRLPDPRKNMLNILLVDSTSEHVFRIMLSSFIYILMLLSIISLPLHALKTAQFLSPGRESASDVSGIFDPFELLTYYKFIQIQVPVEAFIFHVLILHLIDSVKVFLRYVMSFWLKHSCEFLDLTGCLLPVFKDELDPSVVDELEELEEFMGENAPDGVAALLAAEEAQENDDAFVRGMAEAAELWYRTVPNVSLLKPREKVNLYTLFRCIILTIVTWFLATVFVYSYFITSLAAGREFISGIFRLQSVEYLGHDPIALPVGSFIIAFVIYVFSQVVKGFHLWYDVAKELGTSRVVRVYSELICITIISPIVFGFLIRMTLTTQKNEISSEVSFPFEWFASLLSVCIPIRSDWLTGVLLMIGTFLLHDSWYNLAMSIYRLGPIGVLVRIDVAEKVRKYLAKYMLLFNSFVFCSYMLNLVLPSLKALFTLLKDGRACKIDKTSEMCKMQLELLSELWSQMHLDRQELKLPVCFFAFLWVAFSYCRGFLTACRLFHAALREQRYCTGFKLHDYVPVGTGNDAIGT